MCVMLHVNESCHTYESVMSHIWMRHVTYMSESYTSGDTLCQQSRVCAGVFICVTRLIHVCDMAHLYA